MVPWNFAGGGTGFYSDAVEWWMFVQRVAGSILSLGKRWLAFFHLLHLAPNVNNPIWWARSTSVSGIISNWDSRTNLKMEGKYVVELGIIHTCTVLWYKPAFIATVTGHFVPKSFRTQVISYHFGHFAPTFIFNFVISYPIWSFRTHFVPSLVISYLLLLFSRKPFWSFRTYFFYCFVPKSFRTRSHFVPILVISYPGHFLPTSKLGTNWLGYEMTSIFLL